MNKKGEKAMDLFLKAWHQSPLFVAFFTIVLTLLTTQIGGWLQTRADAARMDVALKLAFSGEIHAIRGLLEHTSRTASEAFRQNKTLKKHQIIFPTTIFQANASNLGRIKDRELIKQLATFYSLLDRTNEVATRIDEGIYDASSFQTFLRYLLSCWQIVINLDMRLQEQTKAYTELDWQVVLSKKDADDLNFAQDILKELGK